MDLGEAMQRFQRTDQAGADLTISELHELVRALGDWRDRVATEVLRRNPRTKGLKMPGTAKIRMEPELYSWILEQLAVDDHPKWPPAVVIKRTTWNYLRDRLRAFEQGTVGAGGEEKSRLQYLLEWRDALDEKRAGFQTRGQDTTDVEKRLAYFDALIDAEREEPRGGCRC